MAASTVCITGVSGFIGSHVAEAFLREGHTVRGTVRNPDNEEKVGFLRAMSEQYGGRLTLHRADLSDGSSFGEALQGCAAVIHVASPVKDDAADPMQEIVLPAEQGTRGVLEAAYAAGIRHAVVTSSIAALEGDNTPGLVLDETSNNTVASATYGPYAYSKVRALAVCETFNDDPSRAADPMAIGTIHPSAVLGPAKTQEARSSLSIIHILTHREVPLILPMHLLLVDVRDVAAAHLTAFRDRHVGRWITNGYDGLVSLAEIANVIREAHPELRIPSMRLPPWLLRVTALFDRRLTPYFREYLFNPNRAAVSGQRITQESSFTYGYAWQDSVRDAVESFYTVGLLTRQ